MAIGAAALSAASFRCTIRPTAWLPICRCSVSRRPALPGAGAEAAAGIAEFLVPLAGEAA
jgi:hypothetical protein